MAGTTVVAARVSTSSQRASSPSGKRQNENADRKIIEESKALLGFTRSDKLPRELVLIGSCKASID